uniref:WD_REPEATS_REGION domain-containing protein n=1 Tax=Trichobilharzia regenti TaxID=157069 RepID=A0AA85JB80_TRIRE
VLCSFHGHNLPVLTLCFIDNGYGSNKPHGISTSQLWLASTCQDGSMIIWDISSVTTEAPSSTTQCLSRQLCSSTGCHRRPVTVSAWHPQRQVLATGSLDCLVCLWEMSELGFGSLSYAKPSNLNKLTLAKKLKPTLLSMHLFFGYQTIHLTAKILFLMM